MTIRPGALRPGHQGTRMKTGSLLFGPIPSRRLGRSLGVDIIPRKTCTLNCLYCELGPTDRLTVRRKEYCPSNEVVVQVSEFLEQNQTGIDTITFSGSGEPTLHSGLGAMIHSVKQHTHIPIAVLTNGTLLYQEEVRRDLLEADIVLPSFDARTDGVFKKINKPHPQLHLERILAGLKTFRNEYHGQLWLEILFVEGINDTDDELQGLKCFLQDLHPDKVHLNTVIRPPADRGTRPVSNEKLQRIAEYFGQPSEVIGGYQPTAGATREVVRAADILAVLRRRAMTLKELEQSLEAPDDSILLMLSSLQNEEVIFSFVYRGKKYYQAFDS